MRFKLDENLPIEVASLLQQHGHDVTTVREQQLGGKSDEIIADVCHVEDRALVTLDLDFADIRQYPPATSKGVIVLRPALQHVASLVRTMDRVVELLPQEPLEGSLWVVDDHQVRIRHEGADDSTP
ncbi:MAG: DUF5615 family PIN-like protein [Planctomycetaceae bacterium]